MANQFSGMFFARMNGFWWYGSRRFVVPKLES